tara:strand:+ start:6100 stop:6375 length:276 start_codon:yes stop_codon:yes gene_type:complete
MTINSPTILIEYYNQQAINICNSIHNIAEDFNQKEKCTCQLKNAFIDLSTAIWIFENCDEDSLIVHQMKKVEEIEKEILDVESNFDHDHIH